MGRFSFFGQGIPGIDPQELRGKLIVIEGADGVGRSTQLWLLKQWLETKGHAVLATRMTRSALAGKGLRQAKKGTTLGRVTMALFYATDFADRLEHEVIPALKAGFIVLTDRYIYTLIARALVRGIDPNWIREVYGFALVAILIGIGNGFGMGIGMTLGADFAPSVRRGEFLGVWRFLSDAGGAGGPLVISLITGIASLGLASTVCAGLGFAGTAVMGLLVPETLQRHGPRGSFRSRNSPWS